MASTCSAHVSYYLFYQQDISVYFSYRVDADVYIFKPLSADSDNVPIISCITTNYVLLDVF